MKLPRLFRRREPAYADPPAARPPKGEIAASSGDRDVTAGYIRPGMLRRPQDNIWQEQTYRNLRGYDLYKDLLTDWQVATALQQRRLALQACEWDVNPGGNLRKDKQAAAALKDNLEALLWDDISNGMHFGVYYGYAVGELIYAQDGAQVIIDRVAVRDRTRFAWDGDSPSRLRLLTPSNGNPGELMPPRKFWTFQTGADHDDEPYGMGLAHWLYWPVYFKRNGIKFWLVAAEKFGSPTAAGWFPPGTSSDDQDRLLAALKAIRTDSALIIPEGITVEFLEAKRGSLPATMDIAALVDNMDGAITKIIIGQTMTSEGAGGQYKGDMLKTVRDEIIKADADLICESFNQGPVRWLTDWNYPGAAYPKVWRRTEPDEDLGQRSEVERRLFDIGYRPTLRQVQETYDGEWEAVPTPAPSPESTESPPSPESTEEPETPAEFADRPPSPNAENDAQIERLAVEAAAPLRTMIDQIEIWLAESADLAEFRDKLLAGYAHLDSARLAEVLGLAMTCAQLGGRYDILQDL